MSAQTEVQRAERQAATTPGPWRFESTECDGEIESVTVRADHGLVIAEVEPHHPSVADPIANARLIAAAPELLEALRGVIEGYDSVACTLEERIARARLAIAKVEVSQ